MEKFEIIDEITMATVSAAIDFLNEAVDGNEALITLPYNGGGSVDAAILLIESIKDTKASVTIEVDRYVISAAAFIYLWFFVYPEAHVVVKTTGKPAIFVYHRPRVLINEHLAFIDDLKKGMVEWDSLKEFTDIFDKLFEYLIAACGYSSDNENIYEYNQCELKHQLRHVRDGYYSNQDFVIPA
jgi:hypothetical protein